MCGILGLIKQNIITQLQLQQYTKCFYELYKRGPDQQALLQIKQTLIGFTRLAIMDLSQEAMQPYTFDTQEGKLIFICNGEIYNFQELVEEFNLPQVQHKDCKVIPLLYMKLGLDGFVQILEQKIKGEFAFAIFEYDKQDNLQQVTLGRDLLGIRPLYVSNDCDNKQSESLVFASNIHALDCYKGGIQHFEPGTVTQYKFKPVLSIIDDKRQGYQLDESITVRFDSIYDIKPNEVDQKPDDYYLDAIREALIQSVRVRINSDRPKAFFLSGGLDSSLVASIAQKLSDKPIHTFCCAIAEKGQKANTNDIINARKVAEFIGSIHTEVTFTQQEALDAIPKVIQNIGTWCQTTIRASTPMYLLSKYIKEKTEFKVIFSSDLADELFQGYLFNYEIPNEEQIEQSTRMMIKDVHKYDVLRGDGCISQNGLESRIPFHDQDLIKIALEIPSKYKHPIYKDTEKYWLRQAFKRTETQTVDYLPNEVLFRTKLAFSNSISDNSEKTWIQLIKEYCEQKGTNELDYYKNIFISYFGDKRVNILDNHWQPHRFDKKGQLITKFIDSSAEVLDIYKKKFETQTHQI